MVRLCCPSWMWRDWGGGRGTCRGRGLSAFPLCSYLEPEQGVTCALRRALRFHDLRGCCAFLRPQVKPVTRKEVQNIWTHVMKRFHAAVTQPLVAEVGGAGWLLVPPTAHGPYLACQPGAVPSPKARPFRPQASNLCNQLRYAIVLPPPVQAVDNSSVAHVAAPAALAAPAPGTAQQHQQQQQQQQQPSGALVPGAAGPGAAGQPAAAAAATAAAAGTSAEAALRLSLDASVRSALAAGPNAAAGLALPGGVTPTVTLPLHVLKPPLPEDAQVRVVPRRRCWCTVP